MANMFSGNTEKRIPKSFEECYEIDSVSHDLWNWCEKVEKYGKIVYWILSVLAFLCAFYIADSEYGFDIKVFIFIGVIAGAIISFIYFLFHLVAIIIGSLASIVQHTKITADVSLYTYAKKNNIDIPTSVDENENTFSKKIDKFFDKLNILLDEPQKTEEKFTKTDDKSNEEYAKMLDNIVFCKKCGADISKDKNVCHVCGYTTEQNIKSNVNKELCPKCGNVLEDGKCVFCNINFK